MPSEMQERIARAMCDSRCWPGAFEKANDVERSSWMHDALAVMRAMREPTEVMEDEAGWAAEDGALLDFDRDDFRLIFTAAIDAEIAAAGEPGHDRDRDPLAWVKAASNALTAYEADYGDTLPDDHELGRIDDSRGSPSFRIRVGHIRQLATHARAQAVEPVAAGHNISLGEHMKWVHPDPAQDQPDDIVRLVLAARDVAFTDDPTPEALKELDAATGAFAEIIPWDDEPLLEEEPPPAHPPIRQGRADDGEADEYATRGPCQDG